MDVFLSWSQPRSEAIAKALKYWIPLVLQAATPWLSRDIEKGSRWDDAISEKLDACNFGIICLTPENLESSWVLFEAGALSKKVRESRVCTYLLDLKESDISGPLAKFQHTRAEKDDTRALLDNLNNMMADSRLDNDRFRQTFEQWWPDLAERIEAARILEPSQKPDGRTIEDKVDDVLLEIRTLQRTIQNATRQQQLMDLSQALTGRPLIPRRASLYEFTPEDPAPLQIALPATSIDIRRFSCRTHHVHPLIQELGPQGTTVQVCCDSFGDELRAVCEGAGERRNE